ncbi:MAG TPA: AI-2E family transporter [Archangium sp.]|jgi:predicted PurR-regulated permease PerM|uniref:AI-2E family transporter n=1 Tax=Archangium sp. TaxID=1872627 RepID=UPI002EDAD6FC
MDKARRSQISALTVWTVGLNGLALVLLARSLDQLRPILVLLAVSVLVTLALQPIVRGLQRLGLKRGWSVLVTFLGLLGVATVLGATLLPMLVEQVRNLIQAAPDLVAEVRAWRATRWLEERLELERIVREAMGRLPSTLAQPVLGVLSTTVNGVFALLTVLTLSLFGLLFGKELFEQSLGWVRPSRRPKVRELALNMRKAVGGYLTGTFLTVSLGAVVTAVGTWLLGVPFFLALGSLYLVFGFIPYVGSFLMAVLVSFTTLSTVGLNRALIALGLFLVYQQVEGNLIQPLVQRHSIRMNPLLISVVLLIGGALMGLIGAVLALPVAAALQQLLREVQEEKRLRWDAEADRAPVEAPRMEDGPRLPPDEHDSAGPAPH